MKKHLFEITDNHTNKQISFNSKERCLYETMTSGGEREQVPF